jgi:hypothetical protein
VSRGKEVGRQLGEAQRRQRGLLTGLEHQGVAGHERRADLPDSHQQREVPWGDAADHAEWVAPDEAGVRRRVLPAGAALQGAGGACEEAHVVDAERDLLAGDGDRLADIEGLELGELLGVGLEPVGKLEQQLGPLTGSRRGPTVEGPICRGDGLVDVDRRAHRHGRDLLPVGRVEHGFGLAVGGRDLFACDVHQLESSHYSLQEIGRHRRTLSRGALQNCPIVEQLIRGP